VIERTLGVGKDIVLNVDVQLIKVGFKMYVGFDSMLLKRESVSLTGEKGKPFKALLGVSVTTNDGDEFRKRYDQCLQEILNMAKISRKKRVYKAAHLLKQAKEKTPTIVSNLIDKLEDCIEHIDIYCAYYAQPYISMFGKTRLQRLEPLTYLEYTKNAFPHVCAWWYLRTYGATESSLVLDLDHFEGKVTPAWRELISSEVNKRIFFSGAECNPLISVADLALKLIEIFQRGTVDGRSLFQPIRNQCSSYEGKRKLKFHNLGDSSEKIKPSVPDIAIDMDTIPYLKHPIFFHVWDPGRPREPVKKSFEWSPIYNITANMAFESKGSMKNLSFEEDVLFWDKQTDFLVVWSLIDEEYVEMLRKMGYETPKVIKSEDLLRKKD